MNIIFDKYDNIAKTIGDEILDLIKNKPDATICLPSGETPIPIFNYLIEKANNVDFSKVTFVGLDEFIGLGKDDDGSCFYMLNRDFFSKMPINKEKILFFDGKNNNEEIVKFIEKTVLDYVVLGVGLNGHIGLNEPETIQMGKVMEVNLSKTTKKVMKKYFEKKPINCESGITMSLDYLKQSEKIVIVVNDESKRKIVSNILKEKELPVTNLLKNENARLFVLDELKEIRIK